MTHLPSRSPLATPAAAAAALDERELVAQIRAGNTVAFEQVVRAHIAELTKFAATYTGSRDLARDVVQEVFCAIWLQRATWYPERSVASYLFGAVRHRALNMLRGDRRAQAYQLHAQREHAFGESTPLTASSDDRADLVRRSFALLTERQRTALTLRYDRQLTVPEVASVLNISPKGAEKLLARGIGVLRAALISDVYG